MAKRLSRDCRVGGQLKRFNHAHMFIHTAYQSENVPKEAGTCEGVLTIPMLDEAAFGTFGSGGHPWIE